MTDFQLILIETRKIHSKMDELMVVVAGDNNKKLGLVGKVRRLQWQMKFATYALGVIFSSLALAYAERMAEAPAASQTKAVSDASVSPRVPEPLGDKPMGRVD